MQKSETSTSPFMMTFSLLLQPETQNFIWCQIVSMWKFVAKCQKVTYFLIFCHCVENNPEIIAKEFT